MAEANGRRVRVEVTCILGRGKCSADIHEVGQVWDLGDTLVPRDMCAFAYNSIHPVLTALRFGGRLPWRDDAVATVCCPDADNPVVFRLSAVEPPEPAAG